MCTAASEYAGVESLVEHNMASAPPINSEQQSPAAVHHSSDHVEDDDTNHNGTQGQLIAQQPLPSGATDPPPQKRARLTEPEEAAHLNQHREESPVTPPHDPTTNEVGDPLQYDGIPQGWRRCPAMGHMLRLPFIDPSSGREHKTYLVPMKACDWMLRSVVMMEQYGCLLNDYDGCHMRSTGATGSLGWPVRRPAARQRAFLSRRRHSHGRYQFGVQAHAGALTVPWQAYRHRPTHTDPAGDRPHQGQGGALL